jgi:geranylgeranyl diphosphate synthase type II
MLLDKYAHNIGLAFQIADDILDVYADKRLLGKNGSDKDNDKLTYLSLYGKEKSEENAKNLIIEAKEKIAKFKSKKEILEAIAIYDRQEILNFSVLHYKVHLKKIIIDNH